jgi:CRP-like cAMP-binding protein
MPALTERAFFLRRVPLFARLAAEQLVHLAEAAEEHTFPPASVLFRRGDAGDGLYVVLDGEVSIVLEGREVNVMRAGQSFGEIAVLDSAPRTADAVARTDVLALRIGRAEFERLFTRHRALRRAVLAELALRLETIERRVAALAAAGGSDG